MVPVAASIPIDLLPTDEADQALQATKDPTDAVRACVELPDYVRHARFRQVNERILDAKLFDAIVSQRSIGRSEEDWEERLKRRHEALHPYIGKKLACFFIRLPGVHYTIEVDVDSCVVAFWEWQAD